MFQDLQLDQLIQYSALTFFAVLATVWLERLYRTYSPASARFSTVNASSNLFWKIKKFIGPKSYLILPIGKGLYPLSLWPWKRAIWEARLKSWLTKGASISLIISCPTPKGMEYWQNLVDRFHEPNLDILNRHRANLHNSEQIKKLDTFHPALLFEKGRPQAMWIENFHNPERSVAEDVEYVAPSDLVDSQLDRFIRLSAAYSALLKPGNHIQHLSASKSDKESVIEAVAVSRG